MTCPHTVNSQHIVSLEEKCHNSKNAIYVFCKRVGCQNCENLLVLTGKVSQILWLLAMRRHWCHCSSEQDNDHVIEEEVSHVQLCIFGVVLLFFWINNMNLFVMKTPSKKLDVLASLIHIGRLLASWFQILSKCENFTKKLIKQSHHRIWSYVSKHTNFHCEFYYLHGVCMKQALHHVWTQQLFCITLIILVSCEDRSNRNKKKLGNVHSKDNGWVDKYELH
jgi:hypothetical protein